MKRRLLLCCGLAAVVLLPLAARADDSEPFGRLSVDEVSALIAKHDVAVFDNNPVDMYKQSHLPGAKWVAFNDVKASDLPSDKEAKLVFYCANER